MEITYLFILCTCFCTMATSKKSGSHYKNYVLDDRFCQNGNKKEIHLGTGAAIFTFNESLTSTYGTLKQREIYCNMELEVTNNGYGFNFHFEEINLDSVEENSDSIKHSCKDFVQFGLDKYGITTSTSKEYCGREQKVEYSKKNSENARTKINNDRIYIENAQDDIDLWLRVKSNAGRHRSYNRSLILVVTPFRKDCSVTGSRSQWRPCKDTSYCVKKEYFCDNFANCGRLKDNSVSDEEGCENQLNSSFFRFDNIPVIVVVIMVTLVGILIIVCIVRKVGKLWNTSIAPTQSNETNNDESGITLQSTVSSNNFDGRRGERSNSEDRSSAPPSYDEVVKLPYLPNTPYADDADKGTKPPSYSPQMT